MIIKKLKKKFLSKTQRTQCFSHLCVYCFFLIVYCLLPTAHCFAQDIHFSQFNSSPLNLNPALTGLFDGDYRFVGNDRNQWGSVTVPYKTFSGSYDMRMLAGKIKSGILGGGIIFNNDRAGDASLGITQANLSLSYSKKIDKDSVQLLSVGVQTGIAQRSIDYTKLMFDEQYDGDTYNPNYNTGQNFSSSSFTYFDVSSGVNWFYRPRERFKMNFGASMFHINTPKQNFLNANDVKLHRKVVLHGSGQFKVRPKIDLMPSFIFERQNTFQEFVVGTSFRYMIQSFEGYNNAFYLGGFYRTSDAFIFSTGMDYKNINVGLSYDVNISKLRPASNGRGGLELSVIYIIKKFIPLKVKKKICPPYL